MTSPALALRAPSPADAAALADLHVEVWRETYERQLPASAFDGAEEEALGLTAVRMVR